MESFWTLIRYDKAMGMKYERLKKQCGNGKKAMVGIARTLAIRMKRLLLDKQEYVLGVTEEGSPLPTLDSTRVLARAALREAIGTMPGRNW